MDFVTFLAVIDYGPVLKFLTAFDLARLTDSIAPSNADLTDKSSPEFWDRMSRHYSSEFHYVPNKVKNLNEFIGRMYDCIFLRECAKAKVRPHTQMFPFGPLDAIFVVHPTATWKDFVANPALKLRNDSCFQVSHLCSKSWLLSERHNAVESEFIDEIHLRPGHVIHVKNGSELVTALVVIKRGRYSWAGRMGMAMIEQESRCELTKAPAKMPLSSSDQSIRQHFPMVMKYLMEGGVWGIGADAQTYWRHAEHSQPYPFDYISLHHNDLSSMVDILANLEVSLMSFYPDSRHEQTKPAGKNLGFPNACKFIHEYVSEACNFEIFYYEEQFWLRIDTIPHYLRKRWTDSIRPFPSLEDIFRHLDDAYVNIPRSQRIPPPYELLARFLRAGDMNYEESASNGSEDYLYNYDIYETDDSS